MRAMKILIVDDEPALCRLFQKYLEGHHYAVLTAANALQALRIQKHEHPDLVLTDYNMPEMSGLDLLRELRLVAPTVPVIMMSGAADLRTAALALREHAFDFLTKPIDLKELAHAIDLALERTLAAAKASDIEKNKVIGPIAYSRITDRVEIALLSFLRPLDQMGQASYEASLNRLETEGRLVQKIIVRLRDVAYINNVGLNFLLDLFKKWLAQNKQVVFTDLSDPVHRYLKTLGYLEHFRTTATTAEATKLFV